MWVWSHDTGTTSSDPYLCACLLVVDELPNFIRMITIAPHSNKHDMDYVLDEIEQLGKDL